MVWQNVIRLVKINRRGRDKNPDPLLVEKFFGQIVQVSLMVEGLRGVTRKIRLDLVTSNLTSGARKRTKTCCA